jgi:hypothetical protein
MKKIFIVLLFLIASTNLIAQAYIGHSVDNYAGIHGVVYNPANVVGSPFKADINLVSGSAFLGSDYINLTISDAINGDFDFENDLVISPTNNNNVFGNVDVVGPSFMFNIDKKNSIGVISRARTFYQINNINGELFESIVDGFDDSGNFEFDSSDLRLNVHAWAEVGFSYGRILFSSQNHLLKAGVTLKYLMGAGSAFAGTDNLEGQYFSNNETLSTKGIMNYGTTQDFEQSDINFDNLTSGFGLDLGLVYEYHQKRDNDSIRYFQDPYKFKVAVSVTDIGSINYEDAEFTTYDLNSTVNVTEIEDIQDFLDDNYQSTSENGTASIELPTALHMLLDYRLTNKILISAQANFAMSSQGDQFSNRIINTVVLAPRLETKWFSLYAPISFREYGDTAFGAGLRFGPLSIGSGSVFSNLLSDESQTTDIFVGLKIPIYRK